MAACIWLTPAGDLGIIPELEYYELPLDAYNPAGGQPTFTLISGSLPNGLELYDDGRILAYQCWAKFEEFLRQLTE